jgi:hypothetical protein
MYINVTMDIKEMEENGPGEWLVKGEVAHTDLVHKILDVYHNIVYSDIM